MSTENRNELSEILEQSDLISRVTQEALSQNNPIIIIDGRAGSGKTTLANRLQNQLFLEGDSAPRIIHMDDLYLGWEGLKDGVSYLQRMVLNPLLNTGTASWQEYNWDTNQRQEWREFSGGTPLIIEGCGSLNTFTAAMTKLTIWIEMPEERRKQRSIERDGDKYLQFWEAWSAQELDFLASEKSPELANFILR
jgi:uridine kinase